MEWRLQACSHLENGFQWGYGLIGANRWANIDAVSSFGSTGQRNTLVEHFCWGTEAQPTGFRATGAVPSPLIGFGRSIVRATAMASDLSAHPGAWSEFCVGRIRGQF
jgi:hypothetical protein